MKIHKAIAKPERLVYNRIQPIDIIRMERRKHFGNHAISSNHDEQPFYVYVCHVHDALC
jgi:hypothetical protein